jgi:hypothetical protein
MRYEAKISSWPTLLPSTVLVLLCTLPGLLADARAAEPGSPEPVQAIWKNEEFSFFFQSQTTFYSCSSLEAKLERILKALGVRSHVKVRSVDCQTGPVRMPRVIVNISAPVEATPQAIAERDKSKRPGCAARARTLQRSRRFLRSGSASR